MSIPTCKYFTTVDLEIAKRLLRRRAHRIRNAIDPVTRLEAERRIRQHILELPQLATPRPVLAYASIRSEVSTMPLLTDLVAAGHQVALPRVEDDGTLTARILDALAPGFRGIPEPSTPAIAWSSIEVALVPGLAFDRHGHRLGYGGGYFDRTLMAFGGTLIGIAFACQVVEDVPAGPDDVDVDLIVTEDGTIEMARLR